MESRVQSSSSSDFNRPAMHTPLSSNERLEFEQQREELEKLRSLLAGITLGDVGAVSGSGESPGSPGTYGRSGVFPAVHMHNVPGPSRSISL